MGGGGAAGYTPTLHHRGYDAALINISEQSVESFESFSCGNESGGKRKEKTTLTNT